MQGLIDGSSKLLLASFRKLYWNALEYAAAAISKPYWPL